jgi:tRNA pseudouridine55 synthase
MVAMPELAPLPLLRLGQEWPGRDTFLSGCIVLVDKPIGPPSFPMVALLRRLCGVKKVGHAGTLDPFASGLLILLTGGACRQQDRFMAGSKRYRALLRLGQESDSHDRTGQFAPPWEGDYPAREAMEALLPSYTGEIQQVPPMHSAIQVDGKRMYHLARKGKSVDLPPRSVLVHSLELLGWDPPFVELDLHCGKGFYVRSLARDLGRALGCGALVEELRRTGIGEFRVEEALDPTALKDLFAQGTAAVPTTEAQHAD